MASGEVHWWADQTAEHRHLRGYSSDCVSSQGDDITRRFYSLAISQADNDLLPHECRNWPISSNKSHQPLRPWGCRGERFVQKVEVKRYRSFSFQALSAIERWGGGVISGATSAVYHGTVKGEVKIIIPAGNRKWPHMKTRISRHESDHL